MKRSGAWVILAILLAGALWLRCFSYSQVFSGSQVNFLDGDAWFHMRTIRNLMHHFPHRSGFDPYSGFPTGQAVTTGPFFDLAVGAVAWIAGLGSPSALLVDEVGAWFPAVLGALIVAPVFLLGRRLFSTAAGLFAAALAATFPGNYLLESQLGMPDHHVAEMFLSTLLLLFLVLAIDGKRTVLWTVLSGLTFGCFLATRPAGGFLTAGICGWAVLQCVRDHWHGKSCRRVAGIVIPTLILAWICFLPANGLIWSNFTVLELWTGISVVGVAAGWSMLLERRGAARWMHAGGLAVAAAICGVAVALARPHQVSSLAEVVGRYLGSDTTLSVRELRPILIMNGAFSLSGVWETFGISWIFAIAGLAMLGRQYFRGGRGPDGLVMVWSALMLTGTLFANRMSYFFAVNAALLAGYVGWRVVEAVGGKNPAWVGLAVATLMVAPNLPYALRTVDTASVENSEDWTAALAWLRSNTPHPFSDASAFDKYYAALPAGTVFPYPASAYGIMNWWDNGHWISAVARRIPVSNGMQTGAADAARFFLSNDARDARKILERDGARYIVADATLPLSTAERMRTGNGLFRTMVPWANGSIGDYAEVFLRDTANGLREPVTVFYPAYYRSMLARLYLFDGKAVTPERSTWVLEYASAPGEPRRVVDSHAFDSYPEAVRFMEAHRRRKLVLAGLDPFQSCVPIEAMDDIRLVFNSQPGGGESIHAVKIFEYRRGG